MIRPVRSRCFLLILVVLVAASVHAQDAGTLERIKVFGPSLEGNLEGDDPNRNVIVYLPPGYSESSRRRFPGGSGRATFADAPKAQAAAWSSNPANAPDYFDLPATAGDRAELVAARWPANSPLVMVGQYVPALKSFDGAIAIDVGDQDPLGAASIPLDQELTRLGVEHHFVLYTGDHMNQVPARFVSEVLPFFSTELE